MMNGGNSFSGSMDGDQEPFRENWADDGESMNSQHIERIKEVLKQDLDAKFAAYKVELVSDIYLQVKTAFSDFLLMIALRHLAVNERVEKGWVDSISLQSKVHEVKDRIDRFFNSQNSSVMQNFALDTLAEDMAKLLEVVGLVDIVHLQESEERLRSQMKPIFDMIKDPNLALSERVRSFELS